MAGGNIDEYEEQPVTSRFKIGSEGIWTFVLIDMTIFALIFTVYTAQRIQEFHVYEESHGHLDAFMGCINTMVLLGSSLAVVRAVSSARDRDPGHVRTHLSSGLLLGLCFCVAKVFEYRGEFESGVNIATNSFYTFYFFVTFLHLMHVLAGMLFMNIYRRNAVQRRNDSSYVTELENVGTFWHFVDLVWILIYSLIYLL